MNTENEIEFRMSIAKHISNVHRDSFKHRASHEWYIIVAIIGAVVIRGNITIDRVQVWHACVIACFPIAYLLSLHSRNRMDKECANLAEQYMVNPTDLIWTELQNCVLGVKQYKKKNRFFYQISKWWYVVFLEISIMIIAILIIA